MTDLPLSAGRVVLSEHGIDARQAAELRWRFRSFAEDWERPEMNVYDRLEIDGFEAAPDLDKR